MWVDHRKLVRPSWERKARVVIGTPGLRPLFLLARGLSGGSGIGATGRREEALERGKRTDLIFQNANKVGLKSTQINPGNFSLKPSESEGGPG